MLSNAMRLMTTPSDLRSRILRVYAFLIVFNLGAWGLALAASIQYPILLPTAFLAYTFGLRHAVDADHIAAIDNTTRKLMQDGQRPVGVGLFFSLGHSTIVVALSVLIAISAGLVSDIPALQEIGGLIGTTRLGDVPARHRRHQPGRPDRHLPDVPAGLGGRRVRRGDARGLPRTTAACWRGSSGRRSGSSARAGTCTRSASSSASGFDTASEVALLGLAATSGANHVPIVLHPRSCRPSSRPGMSLVDATDGVLMLGAYGWAYVKPIRKLYYNLNITLVSVLIAFADRRHRGPEHRRRAVRPARRHLGLRRRASTSGSSASGSSRSSS